MTHLLHLSLKAAENLVTGVVEELLVEVCGRAAEAFEASTRRLGPGDLHQLRQDPRPGAQSVPTKRDALGILRYRLGFTLQASSDLKRPEFG